MKDKRISLETAELANKLNFCCGSAYIYDNGKLRRNLTPDKSVAIYVNGLYANIYEAPTQTRMVTWLREIYSIHLGICMEEDTDHFCYFVDSFGPINLADVDFDGDFNSYKIYEDAIENGLKIILKYLLETLYV